MKQLWVCWVLILCGIVVVGPGRVDAAANVEFVGGLVFDFGNVPPNTSLNHEFVFKNTGDAVLRIDNVKGG
jgi:hypothetical protein